MPKLWPSAGTDLSRFLQQQPNIRLARLLPVSVFRRYLSMIGFCYYGIKHEERRNLSKSLRYVLGSRYGNKRLQCILLKTYIGIFEHYSEKMVNAYKSLSTMMKYLNRHVSITGKEWIDQRIKCNFGCILVTGHFGAVEYVPLFLAANHYRPSIILRFKTAKLKETLAHKSKAVDLELIDADSTNVIFKALQAIEKGRSLITMCDEIHNWRPSRMETIQLFGHTIPKDRTLDILYRRSKAPSGFGIIHRIKNGYELSIHPLADGKDCFSLYEAAWHLLEQYIYQDPQQWYQWPKFYLDFTRYRKHFECHENSLH